MKQTAQSKCYYTAWSGKRFKILGFLSGPGGRYCIVRAFDRHENDVDYDSDCVVAALGVREDKDDEHWHVFEFETIH